MRVLIFSVLMIVAGSAQALVCEGIDARDLNRVLKSSGDIMVTTRIQKSYSSRKFKTITFLAHGMLTTGQPILSDCDGSPDGYNFTYNADSKKVFFFACLSGQEWYGRHGTLPEPMPLVCSGSRPIAR